MGRLITPSSADFSEDDVPPILIGIVIQESRNHRRPQTDRNSKTETDDEMSCLFIIHHYHRHDAVYVLEVTINLAANSQTDTHHDDEQTRVREKIVVDRYVTITSYEM